MIRKFILLCLVGLLTVVPSSSLALTAADAFVGYKVCCEKSPSGIYPKDEFVYFVSDEEIPNDHDELIEYEGRSMLYFVEQLKSYFVQDIVKIDESTIAYSGVLGARIRKAIASNEHIKININAMQTYVLVSDSIQSKAGKIVYRYVVAIPVDELKKYRKVLVEDLNQIDEIVRTIFSEASEEDKFQEMVGWYLELGLIEDALYYQRKLLSKQLYLVNYYQPVDPFYERKILRKVLAGVQTGVALSNEYLTQLPANAEVLKKLYKEQQINPVGSIVLLRTMHVDLSSAERRANNKKIEDKFLKLIRKYPSLNEYLVLEKRIRELQGNGSWFFQYNHLLSNVLETSGHLMISDQLSSVETDEFKQAKNLFHKGKKPEKIMKLLMQSIELSPRHLKSWEYLAAILWAQKMELEALLIYIQLYQMDNTNLEIMAHLAECYGRIGLKKIAKNYLEHILVLNSGKNGVSIQKILDRVNLQIN